MEKTMKFIVTMKKSYLLQEDDSMKLLLDVKDVLDVEQYKEKKK